MKGNKMMDSTGFADMMYTMETDRTAEIEFLISEGLIEGASDYDPDVDYRMDDLDMFFDAREDYSFGSDEYAY